MTPFPENVDARAVKVVLLKTSVREKHAYIHGGTIKLFWFDDWAAGNKFVACSILSAAERRQLVLAEIDDLLHAVERNPLAFTRQERATIHAMLDAKPALQLLNARGRS